MNPKMAELKELLLAWRKSEKDHAIAVLRGAHPDEKARLDRIAALAIGRLRVFVDSEPWPDLEP